MSYSLQNYTTYSMTSGTLEPEHWVNRAKELGYTSLGICDKSLMTGHIEFQDLCLAAGINPIFGIELRLVDNCREKEKHEDRGIVLLYAKNDVGYRNMIAINNMSWYPVDQNGGFYYRSRIDVDSICANAGGLIAIIPSNDGAYLKSAKKFEDFARKMRAAFGDDLYFGVNPVDESEAVLEAYDEAAPYIDAGEMKPVTVFNCHYPLESQAHLYDVVRKIDNNRTHAKKNFERQVINGFLPEKPNCPALDEIEQKCQYRIPVGKYFMPKPDLPITGEIGREIAYHLSVGIDKKLLPGFHEEHGRALIESSKTTIEDLCDALVEYGAGRVSFERYNKYPDDRAMETLPVYAERLRREAKVIEKLGFYDYFLIVRDICAYVDNRGEERGPARGSAAGSLFSYLLNITKVDPIEFGLLFERFLNEDRADLPDIDLDFSSAGREAIKDYILQKYGEQFVVSIGAYDRMKIASAVQLVSKAYAMGIPDNDGEIIHYEDKLLHEKLNQHVTATSRGEDELRERLESPVFREFYEKHSDWFDNVIMPLCETVTTSSRHAAGTLITAFPINECIPIMYQGGNINTQWRDRHCEKRGFPKFDILAIKAVDIISYCKKLLKSRTSETIPAIEHIALNDPSAMAIYREGRTDGVFQAKSFIAKNFYQDLDPEDFWDVTNGTALNRPGPIDAGAPDLYKKIKTGEILPEYDTPDMIDIVQKTNGLIIYQEQMMETVQVIGRLSPVEADYVRKACGKKNFAEMAKWESVFIERGLEAGYSIEVLNTLWHKVNAFAGYGFNASHAVSYSIISYCHAWIKARFPTEFWCATLKFATTTADKYDSLFNLKARAVEEGIEFKFPTLYGFGEDFLPAGDKKIYWPMHGIKGIGEKATEVITANGTRNSFKSLDDMILTLGADCNLGVYKTLIMAGFFEPIHELPWMAAEIVFERRNELLGKKDALPYEMTSDERLDWIIARNDVYGFIVTPWKASGNFHPKVQRLPESIYRNIPKGTRVFIGGYVDNVSIRAHKQKNKADRFYAILTIVDEGEEFRVTMWDDTWMNRELDVSDSRPMKGDLIELIGDKDIWSPADSDAEYHQVKPFKGSYMRKVWSSQ